MTIAVEQIRTLWGVTALYVPKIGTAKTIDLGIQPLRRTDDLGRQVFLSKTYELWMAKEQVDEITENGDQVGVFLKKTDTQRTMLKITKIYPEWDEGIPGDGAGMWHVEAVQ